jgi:hypothetical protein
MQSKGYWSMAVLGVLLMLTASGCLEIKVKTTVHPDGSCERVETVTAGAPELPEAAFPLPTDSSWETGWTKHDNKENDYLYTAAKRFESPEALAREFSHITADSTKLRISPVIEKRFRWFFTYLTYKETYHVFCPFTLVPASRVLSEGEIRRISAGEENDTLKKKLDEWRWRNMYEGFHRALLEGARRLDDPTLSPDSIARRKEELLQVLQRDTTTKDDLDRTLVLIGHFFRSNAVLRLRPELRVAWDEAEDMMKREQSANGDYTNTVIMPGMVLDTNADEVKGTTVSWKFSADQFLLRDYPMWVESRVMNIWAVILTGIVAIGLTSVLVVLRLRSR